MHEWNGGLSDLQILGQVKLYGLHLRLQKGIVETTTLVEGEGE